MTNVRQRKIYAILCNFEFLLSQKQNNWHDFFILKNSNKTFFKIKKYPGGGVAICSIAFVLGRCVMGVVSLGLL